MCVCCQDVGVRSWRQRPAAATVFRQHEPFCHRRGRHRRHVERNPLPTRFVHTPHHIATTVPLAYELPHIRTVCVCVCMCGLTGEGDLEDDSEVDWQSPPACCEPSRQAGEVCTRFLMADVHFFLFYSSKKTKHVNTQHPFPIFFPINRSKPTLAPQGPCSPWASFTPGSPWWGPCIHNKGPRSDWRGPWIYREVFAVIWLVITLCCIFILHMKVLLIKKTFLFQTRFETLTWIFHVYLKQTHAFAFG